ncbi:siderophore-interacting protein [Pleomorphomonas koreensis]|uniref:siderophore-interacting protein n=1 Tax=Pleomorphomonas koreensis TaxID=257440 RepID=UPI0004130D00|nr:siderophore-interacting protein [Pleomorphomonas koreensis]
MRETPPAIADHLDRVRRANRRRPVAVVEAFDLTPNMRRLVLDELEPDTDAPPRPAGWIKLHLADPGDGRRSHGRAYTVRERVGGRIVIDMVRHGGLCAGWAQRARTGDRAEISGVRDGFRLDWPPAGEVLLGADETGLPAIAGILAALPPATRGTAWLEVPEEADVQPLDAPPGVTIHFLPRGAAPPGRRLTRALATAPLSPDATVWVAAERTAALDLRAHFEARLPLTQVRTAGYWRTASGSVSDDARPS